MMSQAQHPMAVRNTHSILLAVALALFGVVVFTSTQEVGAQRDYTSCGHFETQEDAQEALRANPELALTLDANDNGVACEEAFPDVVVDPTSCGHFESQEDAQAALDEGSVPNPKNLDGDGDGIACEDAFGEPDEPVTPSEPVDEETTVVRLPSTGIGDAAEGPDHGSLATGLLTLAAIAATIGLRSRFGQSPS